jgi:hypothetical protein
MYNKHIEQANTRYPGKRVLTNEKEIIMEIINTTFYDQTFTHQIGEDEFEEINEYECMITCKKSDGKTFVLNAYGNNCESNVRFNLQDGDNQLTDEDLYEMDASDVFDELQLENNFGFLSEFADIKF